MIDPISGVSATGNVGVRPARNIPRKNTYAKCRKKGADCIHKSVYAAGSHFFTTLFITTYEVVS